MRRIISRELLHDGRVGPRDLQLAFEDIWRINRWFGGVAGTLQLFERVLARTGLCAVRAVDAKGFTP